MSRVALRHCIVTRRVLHRSQETARFTPFALVRGYAVSASTSAAARVDFSLAEQAAVVLRRLGQRDLTVVLQPQGNDELTLMDQALNDAVAGMREALEAVAAGSRSAGSEGKGVRR